LADAPTTQRGELSRLFSAARRDATNGVLDQSQKVRLRYWTHWSYFAGLCGMDPFLRGVDTPARVAVLQAFARHVREGHAGRGHQVRAASVQDALCAVGKTFELDLQPNPTYQVGAYKQYWAPLRDMLRGYRRDDPKSEPQLAVPVKLTEHLLHQAWTTTNRCPTRLATADLINIAFYYLLRVGEYTKPRSSRTNTIPFRVADVTFRRSDGTLIPNTSPLSLLLTATEATIRMPNQKNGVKGQCIHQECTGTLYSPVKSLARRVHDILSHQGSTSTNLFQHSHPFSTTFRPITSQQVNATIKLAAGEIGLYTLGYTEGDVSSHSLRAGGAMAMHLNGVDPNTIRKMGRWKSNTFLMYIHEQISAFATGVSLKMSNHVPFRHIAGPTVTAAA